MPSPLGLQIDIDQHSSTLFDQDLSWLAFNRRSLYEVTDSSQPLLERLLKLANTSAALDEYFMVRMPLLLEYALDTTASVSPLCLEHIQTEVQSLIAQQQAHFFSSLRPHLLQADIHLLNYRDLTDIQRGQMHHRFEDEVGPVLAPLISFPAAAMPNFSNLSLNLAVCLTTEDKVDLAWIKVPRSLPRFLPLHPPDPDHPWLVVPLEQVIVANLSGLFPGFHVQGAFPFRVTRSVGSDDPQAVPANLMDRVLAELQQRQQQGQAVRLEMGTDMPQWIQAQLLSSLKLTPTDFYGLSGWLGLSDLKELSRLPYTEGTTALQPLLPPALAPRSHSSLSSFTPVNSRSNRDIFEVLAQQDLLIHLPYHSFAATVEQFVAQAAADPAVLTIKMTLYRTAGNAPVVRSLMAAAKADKQVVVLVELTAFLDEATNIHWAKSLEKAGAHVVYGVVGLKTHTNLALVVRHEAGQMRQYAYVGTGDYLPDRPQPYEDLGLLTSQSDIGRDLSYLFNFLTGCSRQVVYRSLMVAPETLRAQLKHQIQKEIDQVQAGNSGHLIAKLNVLSDPDIIAALYRASQAGVQVDLIVRGVCRLRPGVPGLSDRIRVLSLLGRYVEHSRILYCQNGHQPQAWIGTADWTARGLDDSIEVMVPLTAPGLIKDVRKRLGYWLADNQNAWVLKPDGSYVRRQPAPSDAPISAQVKLMQHVTNGEN